MRIGRNESCPCGSGRKYKHCHAKRPDELPADAVPPVAPPPVKSEVQQKRRQCSGCRACCGSALQINSPELVKPTGEVCSHLGTMGCSLWGDADMPALCKSYTCNYLIEPGPLGVDDRPDKVGAIVQRRQHEETRLIECLPDGLHRIWQHRYWGPLIQRELRGDRVLMIKFFDDPHGADTMRVRRIGDGLRCELASCDENGNPELVQVEPVHGRPIRAARFFSNQNFPFDVHTLNAHLAGHEVAVLASASTEDDDTRVYFRVSRRQAAVFEVLQGLLHLGRIAAPAR